MSEREGRYRMGNSGDPERTQVDRAWTEDFGEYKVGQPYSMDDDGFGPPEVSRSAGRSSRTGLHSQRSVAPRHPDPAEHTRTEARYEETGYVSSGGQAYARDPRFDGDAYGTHGRVIPRDDHYEEHETAGGFSVFTLALCTIAALVVGVVGTILAGGLGSKPTSVASIDPNAATPQQVTELNNQVAQLTTTIQERDAQIHNIQTELDKVRKESAANNAAATTASQQAAQAEQRKAELDARESILNQQAAELNKLSEQLNKRKAELDAAGADGGTSPLEEVANGVVDSAAGAASEGLDSLINQIRQGISGQ